MNESQRVQISAVRYLKLESR